MLMKVLSHPGHGNSRCCIEGNGMCFSVLKTFHVSSKSPLQVELTGVVLQAFKPCVGVPLQLLMSEFQIRLGHLWFLDPNGPSFGLGENSVLHCKWVISKILVHLLCSKLVIPVWHGQIILLLFQTDCLHWPRLSHCCPQRNDFPLSDVRDIRVLTWGVALLCCAIHLWRGCFVSPVYTFLLDQSH